MYTPRPESDVLNERLKELYRTYHALTLGFSSTRMIYERYAASNPFYADGLAKLKDMEVRVNAIGNEYEEQFVKNQFTNHPNMETRKDIVG